MAGDRTRQLRRRLLTRQQENRVVDLRRKPEPIRREIVRAPKENPIDVLRSQVINELKGDISFRGERGAQGMQGLRGERGLAGRDGKDGKDGKDGNPGRDGRNGTDGKDGKDGKDGNPGRDGRNGTDGKDGQDGKDGTKITAQEIAEKLNRLTGVLDVKVLKGLSQLVQGGGEVSARRKELYNPLEIASGGSIDFGGDVRLTHSTDLLSLSGGNFAPLLNDGASLGLSAKAWSDVFLASGGVINFNAGDATITHGTNELNFAGAKVTLTNTGDSNALRVVNTDVTTQVVFGVTGPSSTSINTGKAFSAGVAGDSFDSFMFYTDGKIGWGDGSGTRDVYLSRNSAGVLQITSDGDSGAADLVVKGGITLGKGSVADQLLTFDGYDNDTAYTLARWVDENSNESFSAKTVGDSTGKLIFNFVGTMIFATSSTPASAAATGTTGTITWDANYIYVCTATNTWKRAALNTW